MEEKKRRGGWPRFLLIWTLGLLILGLIGCALFYRYAAVYERTRPEPVMDALMARSMDEWKADLRASLPEDKNGFEDMGALFEQYFETSVRQAALRSRPDLSRSDREHAVFIVSAGRSPIAEVTLRPKEGAKRSFGRCEWELERINCLDFRQALAAVTLEIDAPRDASLTLNGVPIGEDCLSGEAGDPPYLTELEARFEGPGAYVRYRIEGLCGELAVADAEGRAFRQVETGDAARLRFVLDEPGPYTLAVEAPEEATVRVNGTTLGPEEASGGYDLTRGVWILPEDVNYRTLSYRAQGLYVEPEVSAVGADGEALSAVVGGNGTVYFFYPDDPSVPEEARTAAEDYFRAFLAYSASSGSRAAYQLLLGRILPGTDLYGYVQASTDAMYWASETAIDTRELSFDYFHALSPDCVFCTVSFSADLTASTWHDKLNYDIRSGYQLVLIRANEGWLAVAQANLGE
ncbi:MAG: hypothetical protein ACSW8E_04310 [Clostridia bacterium]